MRIWEIEREVDYGYDMTMIMIVVVLLTSWLIIARLHTIDALDSRRVVGGRRNKTTLRVFQDWNIRSITAAVLGVVLEVPVSFGLLKTYVRHIQPHTHSIGQQLFVN